jgi:hypothetical protein
MIGTPAIPHSFAEKRRRKQDLRKRMGNVKWKMENAFWPTSIYPPLTVPIFSGFV